MTTIARLYKDAELHLLNELNERLPKVTNGLLFNLPMDGSLLAETVGRNLLLGTSKDYKVGTSDSVNHVFIYLIMFSMLKQLAGKEVTFSAYINNTSSVSAYVQIWINSSSMGSVAHQGNFINSGTEGKSSITMTIPNDIFGGNGVIIGLGATPSDSVSYKDVKLEFGSIATPWTPAPEDVRDELVTTNCNLTNQGIYVEEGTTNLIDDDLKNAITSTTGTKGILQSDGFYKFDLPSSNTEIYQNRFRPVKTSTTYTESFLFKTDSTNVTNGKFSISFYTSIHHRIPVIIQKLGYNLYKASASYTTGAEISFRAIDIIGWNNLNGTYFSIRDAQLEEKPYATSFIQGTRPNSSNGVQVPTSYFQFPFSVTMEVIPDIKDGSNSVFGSEPTLMYIAGLWKPTGSSNYWGSLSREHRNTIINGLEQGFRYTLVFRQNNYDVYLNNIKLATNSYFSGTFDLINVPYFTVGCRGYEPNHGYANALYKNIAFYTRELTQSDVDKLCNNKFSIDKYGSINGLELIEKLNLILNGNFIYGVMPGSNIAPTNWIFFGARTNIYNGQGHPNYNTLNVLYIGHDTVDSGIKQILTLNKNTLYTIKFSLGKENVTNIYCNITYYDSSNNILSTSLFNYDLTKQDTIQSFIFTTPASFDHCAFIHGSTAYTYGNGFLTRLGNVQLFEGYINKMSVNKDELHVNQLVEGSVL